jgi:bacillithiol system protein YtxJ
VGLRERMVNLTTPDEVDAFVRDNPACAIFKVGTCHKTPQTFVHVEAHLGGRPDLPVGLIRVVESRAASNRVEETTGIRHESPQLILFRDGRAVFDRDNWDITDEGVAEGMEVLFPAVEA